MSDYWVHSTARQQIEIKDQFGVTHDIRSFPITDANLSGMGWDAETGTLWITTPHDYGVRRIDTETGEILGTRGWDADLQPPQSIHRDGEWLWIVTREWVHRYPLQDDIMAPIPEPIDLALAHRRYPILFDKQYSTGDLW